MKRANPAVPPKKRCRFDSGTLIDDRARPVRMKKSGRPHEQIWLRSSAVASAGRLKVRAAASLDEFMCGVTRASLSPSHFSFLQRPARVDVTNALLKARDFFDRFRLFVRLPVKRIAAAAMTIVTLIHTSQH